MSDSAIAIFDSGIGGLSVLQALRQALPQENFVYLADSAYAPYGERGAEFVRQRSAQVSRFLLTHYELKALVIACNTATTAAIGNLRQIWPNLPIVGVEPAIKPAALGSKTGHIGVIATRATVESPRFAALCQEHAEARGVKVSAVACDGLASAIEIGDQEKVQELCARYLKQIFADGAGEAQIDALVLGCTHYVFAKKYIQKYIHKGVEGLRILDTGAAVARQTEAVLRSMSALAMHKDSGCAKSAKTVFLTTGAATGAAAQAASAQLGDSFVQGAQEAASVWFQLPPSLPLQNWRLPQGAGA